MLVCICKGVNEDDINEALASGACSVDDIKSETKACTQCGKCEKMVTRMIQRRAGPIGRGSRVKSCEF